MSSDAKGKGITETIAEELKGVAVEVYKDAAKPAVAHVGKMLGLVVDVTLAIPRMILGGAKIGLDKLEAALKTKLGGVPQERLLSAPATIGAPAALQYLLLGDGADVAELREMFENLLAVSMDRETAASAHPAFVSMISQLMPEEAWLLKSIDQKEYPLFWVNTDEPNIKMKHGFRSLLAWIST